MNKVATAVQLRLDVYALRLPPDVFARMRILAGSAGRSTAVDAKARTGAVKRTRAKPRLD